MNFDDLPIDAPGRRRLPILLRKAWYGLNQSFRRSIKLHEATPDQFTVLRQLVEAPSKGVTQRELCRLMCSDPNTIAALLSRMERRGLLDRLPHESDRRAHRIRLQPKGRKLYLSLRKIALKLQSSILEALPPQRRETFLKDLELVADACAVEAAGGAR